MPELETDMSFDPENHGFIRLTDFKLGGSVDVFECRTHSAVDGHVDLLRLNIYISRDGTFVTIWSGLVEPWLVESKFNLVPHVHELDFTNLYNEPLFCGRIEDNDDATVILRCIGVTDRAKSLPSVLCGAPDDLRCEPLA